MGAGGLTLNARYNPVQPSGYQLPGTTTTSSLQHLTQIPSQSYYIGANTPQSTLPHQAAFQSRQHLQGLTYGQVVATGSTPQGYLSGTPPGQTVTTGNALTSYNVGYGHLTTTSSYTSGSVQMMQPSGAPPNYDTTSPAADTFTSTHAPHTTHNRQWSTQNY